VSLTEQELSVVGVVDGHTGLEEEVWVVVEQLRVGEVFCVVSHLPLESVQTGQLVDGVLLVL